MPVLTAPATATAPALRLRPWSAADAAALAEVCPYEDLSTGPHEAAALPAWLRTQEEGWEREDRFGFAILERDGAGERLVGHVLLKDLAPPQAEVGYWTTRAARGRAVAPRAVEAVTGWAFATRGLTRLHLLHQEDNTASCRVAEKSGYAFSRVLPPFPPAFPRDGHLHVRHLTA
ncbi:GNAT family N-acetyltransferase [Streptomyces sp. CA-253872]|uniref:GNAT family N-acetyltransferase n=1 Tax=Streptomyces sp. CA-253872 TaxID=3240067 RepID=UPI003D8FC202